jgi:hypothetical protein
MVIPHEVKALLKVVESSTVGLALKESTWLFPTIETLHVMALAMTFGSIAMVDLRLFGLAWRDRGIKELSAEILPWTWISFVVTAITGALLFSSAAVKFSAMLQFQGKMALIVLAGLNMLYFQFVTFRRVDRWNTVIPPPPSVRVAGLLSLSFWLAVITLGRWIGFV